MFLLAHCFMNCIIPKVGRFVNRAVPNNLGGSIRKRINVLGSALSFQFLSYIYKLHA